MAIAQRVAVVAPPAACYECERSDVPLAPFAGPRALRTLRGMQPTAPLAEHEMKYHRHYWAVLVLIDESGRVVRTENAKAGDTVRMRFAIPVDRESVDFRRDKVAWYSLKDAQRLSKEVGGRVISEREVKSILEAQRAPSKPPN